MANPGMRHSYTSTKSDPVDTTLVGKTKWNDRHYMYEDDGTTASGALGDLLYRGTSGLVTLVSGAQGLLYSAGSGNVPAYSMTPTLTGLTVTTLTVGAVTLNATEAGFIDGVTAGTAAASKALVLDASADLTGGLRNVVSTGYLRVGDGTAAAPSFSFGSTGNTDNGMFLSASDTVAWSAGGTQRLSLSTTALTSTVPYVTPTGVGVALGGLTSSFPGLARAGSGLDVVLADNSDFSSLRASTFTVAAAAGGMSWSDITLSRISANLLGLASGDSFQIVSGYLAIGPVDATGARLSRNGTGFDVVKADDSAFSSMRMFSITTTDGTFLHKTSAALANGAAAQVGTLTNAPTAGNPTKWIPIDDNGTTRYLPAW